MKTEVNYFCRRHERSMLIQSNTATVVVLDRIKLLRQKEIIDVTFLHSFKTLGVLWEVQLKSTPRVQMVTFLFYWITILLEWLGE